ncbi:MMPL family transporter [Corynebacterium sp. H130]|uniref:MMPL family transporter n=1 Tax=Corynebacterium sp. H130 TaxID=3133444 RepID=UPI00309E41BA
MSGKLFSLGHFVYRKWWVPLLVWLVVFVGAATAASVYSTPLSKEFSIPDLPSLSARNLMDERFPPVSQADMLPVGKIVVQVPEGEKLSDPQHAAKLEELIRTLQQKPGVAPNQDIKDPMEAEKELRQKIYKEESKYGFPTSVMEGDIRAVSPLNAAQDTGIFEVRFNRDADLLFVEETLHYYDAGDWKVSYFGPAFDRSNSLSFGAEILGVLVALLVLLLTFGSLVAAGMPIVSALSGIGISIAGTLFATRFSEAVNFMAPSFAVMIGLAVGIDYSLFILARFRSEVDKNPERPRAESMGIAISTAGHSVCFAGLTVIIALVGLTIFRIPFLTALAHAAAGTVLVAVALALTLLPALSGLLGQRLFPRPRFAAKRTSSLAGRWATLLRTHPVLVLIPTILFLALCAIPAKDLQVAMPTDSSAPLGTHKRTSADMIEKGFGPGRNYPLAAVVDASQVKEGDRKKVIFKAAQEMSKIDGVAHVQPTRATDNLDTVELLITTDYTATDERAAETVERLREHSSKVEASSGLKYGITGMTPIFIDLSNRLTNALLPYITLVMVLALIVLTAVFRSFWVPVLATVGFLLSIGATFGVSVALFQEGALGIFDDPQPLVSFLPIILIGLVFGLAMDYHVFLVSRMREARLQGMPASEAITHGFLHSARVISAAALIMIAVFASFLIHDEVFIKTLGFALATAVFFDAFLVRMTIIPAFLYLLDKRAFGRR